LEKFSFRVGKYGAYVCTEREGAEVCASVPESESPADITPETADKWIDQKIHGADALGYDPKTNAPIYVLSGRYGPYVQLGDATDDASKPKRVSLPAGVQPEQVDLPMALQLLELPKTLGTHPGVGKPVQVGLGRFGPFVVCDGDYRSIPKGVSLFEMNFDKAMEMLAQPKKGRGRAAPLKELGPYPDDKQVVNVMNGPYGAYVKWGKVNASLPEGETVDTITLEKAIPLLADKADAPKAKKKRRA